MNRPENAPHLSLQRNPGFEPYPFTKEDLSLDRLSPGVEHTLAHFSHWRETHPTEIDAFLMNCREQLEDFKRESRMTARVTRRILPPARQGYHKKHMTRELAAFGVRNVAEMPSEEKLNTLYQESHSYEKPLQKLIDPITDIPLLLESQLGIPKESNAIAMIEERLQSLYKTLPDSVIRNGAMGKVTRTMLGVGAIAAYDLGDATPEEKRERFERVIPGALVYGALYAVIDDTLHDLQGNFISPKEKEKYHQKILQGLTTGEPIDTTDLPDHPLADEIKALYDLFTTHFPISDYPHLYQAAESMYLVQDKGANWTLGTGGKEEFSSLYPDTVIKAGMSRVIANILAGRNLDERFYQRAINASLIHQFRDDLVDYEIDLSEKKVTPFTYHPDADADADADTDPLLDLLTYNAYIANVIIPGSESALAYSQAIHIATHLAGEKERTQEVLRRHGKSLPDEAVQLLIDASHMSQKAKILITPIDKKIRDATNLSTAQRDPKEVDPRTFILDRIETINSHLERFITSDSNNLLDTVMAYTLEAGGKRLRPALTLMLAESIGVDPEKITPLLQAGEILHTTSLLFDDLPWQDNSDTRRGRPTAHTVYDPSVVELSGISMLMEGIGVLQKLKENYSPTAISEVTTYTTNAIQEICRGQAMDLSLEKHHAEPTLETILEMYHLKTSVAIEASLIPLMMLEGRPQEEILALKKYAHHAGIVFQLRDDILDETSSREMLGKNVQQDINKYNVVQLFGGEKTQEFVDYHLQEAILSCLDLPFNTNLLQGIVRYFAERKK